MNRTTREVDVPRIGHRQHPSIQALNYSGNLHFEAQRMDNLTVSVSPLKAKVIVFFLDETHRLNPPEQGSIDNIRRASDAAGKSCEVMKLSASLRCVGGASYNKWIEHLLQSPSEHRTCLVSAEPWKDKYAFEVWDDIGLFLHRLGSYHQPRIKVAMVASFTESTGVMSNPNAPDNLRIGYPLTSGFDLYKNKRIQIPWLMSPSEYTRYWLFGNCNKLDMVASIYGAQGFESDYVGVVWGRDLLYRDGKWVLGNPNHCYDGIDRLTTGRAPSRNWCSEALTFVINRYRIFLTRGIKGTLIFCEDEVTREYLFEIQQ